MEAVIRRKSSLAVENAVGVAHLLQIDASLRRGNIPAAFDQTEGEAAAGHGRTYVPDGRDGPNAIRNHVVAVDIASSLQRHVAGLRAKSAGATVGQPLEVSV